ncbi:MAG: AMP-binding protein, partial [Acidimicrobiales bacterium]
GDVAITYSELDSRANAFAHHLMSIGVKPGDSVALLMHNEPDYLVMLMGCFKTRAVPINLDVSAHIDELVYVLTLTSVGHIFYASTEAATADELARLVPNLLTTANDELLTKTLLEESCERDFEPRSGRDHYILFTGGSTGRPVGVVWRQEDAFFAALGAGNWSGPPVDRPEQVAGNVLRANTHVFICSPLRHASAQWVALAALLSGATVVLSQSRGFDAETVLDEIDQHAVTLLSMIGDAFARPLLSELDAHPQRWDLSTLNGIFSGGAVLSKSVSAQLLAHMPTAVIVDSYGSTETGGQGRWVTAAGTPVDDEKLAPPRFVVDQSSAVIDEDLKPVEADSGQIGRIARSGHVPVKFLADDETKLSCIFEREGERWVVTHDLGRVTENGAIELLGRENSSLNSGGKLVQVEEVEAAVANHAAVLDVVVTGTPDEVLGQRITAVVERRDGHQVSDDEIRLHCRSQVAGYKVPRDIIWVDKVERNHLGKLDRGWAKRIVGAPEHLQS